jgi:DNA excision repair protein ERCC-3
MVGIMCIEQLKCSTLIICDSNVSVDQWKRELEKCTTVSNKDIVRITGFVKDKWNGEMPVVVLTTYSWLIA